MLLVPDSVQKVMNKVVGLIQQKLKFKGTSVLKLANNQSNFQLLVSQLLQIRVVHKRMGKIW